MKAHSPSPFFKLSSELSRQPLRVAGAVPFGWEQSPGCRKQDSFAVSNSIRPMTELMHILPNKQPDSSLPDRSPSDSHSLDVPFEQGDLEHPDALRDSASRSRSSSASSSISRRCPSSSVLHTPVLRKPSNQLGDGLSDSASDVFTATLGGGSVNNSMMLSGGPPRPPGTPMDARDFIIRRFLPAAHKIAWDLPQTPSRRFMRTPATPSHGHGGLVDFGQGGCSEQWPIGGPKEGHMASPSFHAPLSVMSPPRRKQMPQGSFRTMRTNTFDNENEDEDTEGEDENIVSGDDEDGEIEPPSTAKACGFLPFRLPIPIYSRRGTTRLSSSSRSQQRNQKLVKEKGRASKDGSSFPKRTNNSSAKRIIKILQEEHQPSSLQGVSCVEKTMIFHRKTPSDSASDLRKYGDEASDSGSFYDVPSRFCSPSPSARQHENAMFLQTDPRFSSLRSSRRPFPFSHNEIMQNSATARFAHQNLPGADVHGCTMQSPLNSTLAAFPAELRSPSSLSPHHGRSERSQCISDNVLYDDNQEETVHMSRSVPRSLFQSKARHILDDQTTIADLQQGNLHRNAHTEGDVDMGKSVERCNGSSRHGERDRNDYGYNGNMQSTGVTCTTTTHKHACRQAPILTEGHSHAMHWKLCGIRAGANEVQWRASQDVHEAEITNNELSTHSNFFPLLPKSPTHSWLERAMPSVTTAGESPNALSRLGYQQTNTVARAVDCESSYTSMKSPAAASDSRWESLVKASHQVSFFPFHSLKYECFLPQPFPSSPFTH
ncbi:hypothetical protein KP509_28G008900 [Ceratopteris richardii]|uniref:Uncharacterized protein n=1 Tax=Ceratopteris richardii TaxID=49495 RepID=A0A8T2R9E3_CERRI|nr:hypothetical protein KP509_28G008900 [Ceratopteris richardii]